MYKTTRVIVIVLTCLFNISCGNSMPNRNEPDETIINRPTYTARPTSAQRKGSRTIWRRRLHFTIVGDSISSHAPTGYWPEWRGMAASSLENDWIHLMETRLAQQRRTATALRFPHPEGFSSTFSNVVDKLDTFDPSYYPTHVIVQVTEHFYSIADLIDDATIDAWFAKVDSYAVDRGAKLIVVGYGLNAPGGVKNAKALTLLTGSKAGGWFVNLDTRLVGVEGAFGVDPYNDPPNAGVEGHPSDYGMRLIANAVLNDVWGLSL